jgi:peptidoglycan/LPS O-acetylase OafA/YrhL
MRYSNMNSPSTSKRYLELDALRGIAAVLVVFFHFTMGRPEASLGFKFGATGVDLFFIISGFVIFMSLSKIRSVSDFWISRVSRLYPTYWAAVTFTFVIKTLHTDFALTQADWWQYVGNLTMFQFYLNLRDLDDSYWTMIIEMLFYGSIIAVFAVRLLWLVEPLGVFASVLLAIASHFYSYHKFVYLPYYYIPILPFAPLFFAGILFYKIQITQKQVLMRSLALVACFASQCYLFKFGRSHDYISATEYGLVLSVYFGLFGLFVSNNLRVLVSPLTLFLGKISFALYLIHEYVSINVVIPFLTKQLHLNFWMAAGGIAFPLAVLLAFLITEYVEVPVGRWMKSKLRQTLA